MHVWQWETNDICNICNNFFYGLAVILLSWSDIIYSHIIFLKWLKYFLARRCMYSSLNWFIIASDKDLFSLRCQFQPLTWIGADLMSIGHWDTQFNKNLTHVLMGKHITIYFPQNVNHLAQAPHSKDLASTLIGRQSDTFLSDRCLIDVDPNVFATRLIGKHLNEYPRQLTTPYSPLTMQRNLNELSFSWSFSIWWYFHSLCDSTKRSFSKSFCLLMAGRSQQLLLCKYCR